MTMYYDQPLIPPEDPPKTEDDYYHVCDCCGIMQHEKNLKLIQFDGEMIWICPENLKNYM